MVILRMCSVGCSCVAGDIVAGGVAHKRLTECCNQITLCSVPAKTVVVNSSEIGSKPAPSSEVLAWNCK